MNRGRSLTLLIGIFEAVHDFAGFQHATWRAMELGRKVKLTLHQHKKTLARMDEGETLIDIARSYNVSHCTISGYPMKAVILYRTDPARNMQRFYRLDVQPDLFGQWCLMRDWGRIGTTGRGVPSPSILRRRRKRARQAEGQTPSSQSIYAEVGGPITSSHLSGSHRCESGP